MAAVMNVHYPSTACVPAHNTNILTTLSISNHTNNILNEARPFELLTDAQALELAYQGVGGIAYPLNSVNTILHKTVPIVIGTDSYYK